LCFGHSVGVNGNLLWFDWSRVEITFDIFIML